MAAGHQHHRAGRRQTNDTQPLLAKVWPQKEMRKYAADG